MGKVDELQHAVDHGVAERYRRIHETQGYPIDEHLGQIRERVIKDVHILVREQQLVRS
jgi:hypothetical protein